MICVDTVQSTGARFLTILQALNSTQLSQNYFSTTKTNKKQQNNMSDYESQFLPKSGSLPFKKLARELYAEVKGWNSDLQKLNPQMVFLLDWDSVTSLPGDLKYKFGSWDTEDAPAVTGVVKFLMKSRRIARLCSDIPEEFMKDPDCKEAFLGLTKMTLKIVHNPNKEANDFEGYSYKVNGTELDVTLECNVPVLMTEGNCGYLPSSDTEAEKLMHSF